jgi:hypothetical protein
MVSLIFFSKTGDVIPDALEKQILGEVDLF